MSLRSDATNDAYLRYDDDGKHDDIVHVLTTDDAHQLRAHKFWAADISDSVRCSAVP